MGEIRDWGHQIDSAVIEAGLRRLQPDLHFDMGTKLGMWHPYQNIRQGVYYKGTHICSMDRGLVPEFKVWNMADHPVPVGMDEMDRDDVVLRFEIIPKTTPFYTEIKYEAMSGRLADAVVRPDGEVMRLRPWRVKKIKNRVILVGWRHTFEALLRHQVPGITRQNLGSTFGIDMFKYPVGPPEEVYAALTAE